MALGVTKYNPLAQDPDYPQAKSNVSDATKITNPTNSGSLTAVTSQFPSMPIPGQVVYDANGIAIPDLAAKTRGAYELGLGQNDALSQAWYNIDPTKTQFGGATTPKPVVSSTKTGGTGGTGGMTATEALALAKFNYDKQQDAQKLGGLQNYYDSGAVNTGFDKLLAMIGEQGKTSEAAVSGAYDKAITNLNQGYDAAKGLGDSGYAALNAYLGANQNDPYAGMRATVGSAPDALTQYLGAYGVSDKPVQGQIQADLLQAQQGAGNFNNLTNLLSSIAQSGASSRGAESAMGQNLFNTTLGQERAGYRTKAEMAQADAMRQIQQIMYEQRMTQESARNSQLQQLAQALAAAGGNAGGVASTAPATLTNTSNGSNPEIDAAYASKMAAYNRPAQTNEEIAALRAQQEEARQNEIRQQMAQARGGY
ncbi:hypothetical protein UFOVP1335_43 [uncultured Caudovirales phage]|uniref:Uncharacterized protein n=1 Tax=uncultured Caudovirales phage TaxID=2100421 RepID=A0A6J5PQ90_9CAUD|nr:hypothetical protein UFOVP914_9 [uncultured Caudovirales phage]CAB4182486.1 hypothetical protein UFOVP1091_3 [uncultured Caudovirales phage]CAB4199417.1 hypothetical protein UFOVP1335_43 [uncultured Caudovirales phage]CAB4212321.1 hypothetical protein UFOVP1445_3 [uncultured Caudovirales phage]